MRRTRNPVYCYAVPRVRIPPFPPVRDSLKYAEVRRFNLYAPQAGAFSFAGRRLSANGTILIALRRMGYQGRMTGHGFRSIASTALNEMGYRWDVIEAQLSHVEGNRTRAAYNHARYFEERRELMKGWADYLDAVRQSGKVIPFRQARAPKAAA